MKFKIERTSGHGREEPPCEGCERESYTYVDERTVDDPAKLRGTDALTRWYKRGANHRVENGHIKRDFPDTGWFREIGTLEEMIAFMREHGELVLRSAWGNPEILTVEIYDDERE